MNPLFRTFLWLAITVIVFYILHIGKDLIIPLVLAVFIWYLINVLSIAISRVQIGGRALPAPLRYLLSGFFILAGLALLFDFVTQNIAEVKSIGPGYHAKLQPIVDSIYIQLGLEQPPSVRELLRQFDYSEIVSRVASAIGSIASRAGIIFIYVIFLFLEQRSFGPKIKALARGDTNQREISNIIAQIDRDIRSYIGIKTLTSAITGLLSYAIMHGLGLDFAAFWGLLIFFFNYIPTIGSILATLFPSLLALIVFEDPWNFVGVLGGVTAVQIMVGSFLEPRLMGNTLNLSPLVILLSLGLWGALWGIPGMFLCVPITVIATIIFSHFGPTRPVAILLSSAGKLKESS